MGDPVLRKYGVQTTVNFILRDTDGLDFKVDAAHVAGDTKIMKNEGAEVNTDNGFIDEGQGYSIVVSATEMEAARITVYIVDADAKVWQDQYFTIETYGNASAQHALDLGTALASQTIGTCTTNTDMRGTDSAATATNLATHDGKLDTLTTTVGTNGDGLTAINLPNQTMDIIGNITGNLSGTVGSVSGAVGSVAANVDGNVTGTIGGLAAQAKTDVNTEVDDVINTDAAGELAAIPALDASLGDKIKLMAMATRNGGDADNTTLAIFKDDGSDLGTASIGDAAGTFTRGKMS